MVLMFENYLLICGTNLQNDKMRTQEHTVRKTIRKLLHGSSAWKETNDASVSSISLSYQSLLYPERHVWIETGIDIYGALIIDLEDWYDETHWDNSVEHLVVSDCEIIAKIAKAWLQGESLETCRVFAENG